MAILTLTSDHPEFTQLIKKHPEGGMQLREIRNGTSFGWYETPQTYCMYFQDYGTNLSFRSTREEQQHYLNVKQYSAPQVYLSLMTEYLKSAMKTAEAEKSSNQLILSMVEIKKLELLQSICRILPEFEISQEVLMDGFYQMKMSSDSLSRLLQGAHLVLLLLAKESSTFLDESESLIQRGIEALQFIKAPYYLRNLFVRKFMYKKETFFNYKEALEENGREEIIFSYRGTGYSRIEKVRELLDMKHDILDVGCGGGAYFRMAEKVDSYIGVDIDPEVLAYAKDRGERMGLANVTLYPSLDEVPAQADRDILLMEVIEHMSLEEAAALLQRLLNQPFHRLILSTPNKDFNGFYGLSEKQFRHEDHKFELRALDFQTWISATVGSEFSIQFFTTGDQVNGIATTQGAMIERKE
ncbi:class I SAM-dependent methyltransferase [Candidatus Enterococcus murrayae]|uniref:Small RNA 2'-O-methyltransferase n=1 Tax=Candidatus Enterococcus murrayae TaxID=2815321 RepID=A0ABS3HHX3_9ENTE|nr:class I SAM-dependent methyltransferase [Enterococcus sp. MJM16]MBO0453057.1 methyltransferase domain-containing protein [Enterococcus sp. MJM16]